MKFAYSAMREIKTNISQLSNRVAAKVLEKRYIGDLQTFNKLIS
jgi:hypothetical protein